VGGLSAVMADGAVGLCWYRRPALTDAYSVFEGEHQSETPELQGLHRVVASGPAR
jgi:hypothetical protein